ncbi:prolyl oligopeptidase family serine peptidase [bacterium]|nr:prolyl oligopeptidase family serine peptidase [bacterium]
MRRTRIALLIVILLFAVFFAVKKSSAKTNPKKWTIDDVLKQESARSFYPSSDGEKVVWVKQVPEKELNQFAGDIYLTFIKSGKEVRLTRGKTNDYSPQLSPNGSVVAFMSVRGEGKTRRPQIWLIDLRGGEPWQLTKREEGVQSFHWLDNNTIIFTARENKYYFEQELKKKKDDSIIAGDQEHFLPVRLYKISIKKSKASRITMNKGKVGEFAISPDGRWLVTNESQNIHYPYDFRIPPKQFLINLETGKRVEIFTQKGLNPSRFAWSLDSRGFFARYRISSDPEDTYVSVSGLGYFDVEKKIFKKIYLNWKRMLGFYGYHVTVDGILVSLANGPWNKLAFFYKENGMWKRQWLKHSKSKNLFVDAVSADGKTVIYDYTTASIPRKTKAAEIKDFSFKNEKTIITLNKWIKNKAIAKSEIIRWKGAKGDMVDGVLYYPFNYEQGKKYPLVVAIHGGPTGVDADAFRESWAYYPNILSGRGAFVLRVNYHGSGNYGLKWMESIKKHYYELEVPDILNGVDDLIKKGMADKDKLGIMGWSNGAILTIQCIIETNRFKAAASGAGDVNWTSDYGNCAFGAAFDNAYFGGPPWKRPRYYIKKSPLFKMEKVTTPTLIFFGTKDTNVPTEQGWEHYHALQQIGKAPVRFILFPGEPHGPRKITHQRRKMEEELVWFDKYLFKTYKEKNEALRDGSPLADILKKIKAKKSSGYYGIGEKGKLIPEVVCLDSMSVGRFEITRAQYASFDKNYIFQHGTGNLPVTNITFDKAKQYAEWLKNLTNKNYRLPTEKEMKNLLSCSGKQGNTLDFWAGYSVNPDDAILLKEEIRKVKDKDFLLKPVGSFKGFGEDPIYDLNGNAAEWCIKADGKGVVMGFSAVSICDKSIKYEAPAKEFVGFRVVKK